MKTSNHRPRRMRGEFSFSLIETVIALGIVTFLIIEVSAVQGNSIVFSEYGRNITQASWLARRVMAEVEYNWQTRPIKDIMQEVKETPFEDFKDYSYVLDIKEWKFPFVQLLTGALGGGKDDDKDGGKDKKDEAGGAAGMLDTVIKQVFGDEPQFLTAHVEVSWPEGANRNSVGMTYLLTNQRKLDEAISKDPLKSTYDKLSKPTSTAAPPPQSSPTPAPDSN